MVKSDPTNVVARKRRRVVVEISMRPVDNFSAPRLARWSISAGACRRVGVCVQVSRFIRRGSLGDRGNDLECRGSAATERSSLRVSAGDFPDLDGRFLHWSGRELRTGIVDGPAADRRDRHMSPSLCFVIFVRLNNLAQNHFRNASASCASRPCSSLLNAPAPWP